MLLLWIPICTPMSVTRLCPEEFLLKFFDVAAAFRARAGSARDGWRVPPASLADLKRKFSNTSSVRVQRQVPKNSY
jgi:hypothetical protein